MGRGYAPPRHQKRNNISSLDEKGTIILKKFLVLFKNFLAEPKQLSLLENRFRSCGIEFQDKRAKNPLNRKIASVFWVKKGNGGVWNCLWLN